MKTFAGQQMAPLFHFSWLLVILSLLLCGAVALVLALTVDPGLSTAVSLSLLALLYFFFGQNIHHYNYITHDALSLFHFLLQKHK